MEHLTKIKLGARVSVSYLSPETQNEFINLLGQQVRSTIIRRIQEAKYYCVIFDSTPDISHNDQMSQVLRYVHIEGEKVAVVESFIDFFEPKGKNAEDLSNDIIAKITSDGLDIQNLRGQAYDNAATMSGIHNGVQARTKTLNPKAIFVACTNHSLNLAGVHTASESVDSVTFFVTLEKLFAFFSASTVRCNALVAITGQAVKRVTETRWSARHVAVKMLKNKFEVVLEVLEQLTDLSETSKTRSVASLLLTAMQSFNFLTFLGFWAAVLPEVDDAQIYLQQRGLSVDKCAQKLCALKTLLVESRDRFVQEAIDFAKNLCEKLGIELKTRIRRKKRMHGDESSEDAALSHEQEIRREIIASFDKIIQEMTTRFKQIQEISDKFGFLMPAKLLDSKFECDLSHVLEDIDKDEFQMERKRLQQFVVFACSESEEDISGKGPLELLQFIQKLNLGISVPNIVILIRI
ncbi:zinc finger MYM-type protein 1-like [Bacillus rossius redtenbacheri]|uniref:zinc finger MYM-type protein 1-like n=1 Tax=Bacillus rossius redtenbacheri TaxID=93214 RepID=UPI002FDCAA4C